MNVASACSKYPFRTDRWRVHRVERLSLLVSVMVASLSFALTASAVGGDTTEYRRPYGPEAPWNIRVESLPRHSDSEYYSYLLWSDGPSRAGNFNLGFESYTYPVYDVNDATMTLPLFTDWPGSLDTVHIPWHPDWRPATGDDAQIILLEPETGQEWNLFQVSFDNEGVYATNANLVPGSYWRRTVGFQPSRGAGIPYLAMLVRPEEIFQGRIEHALSMPVSNPDGNFYVAPATKLEDAHGRTGVPEGMRFALDITPEDIDAWVSEMPEELSSEMKTFGRIVATALMEYGWFITDRSGGATFQFEANASARDDWLALGLEDVSVGNSTYPRDILDGLITPENIYTIVPSDEYE